jgi:hypothetical protein
MSRSSEDWRTGTLYAFGDGVRLAGIAFHPAGHDAALPLQEVSLSFDPHTWASALGDRLFVKAAHRPLLKI